MTQKQICLHDDWTKGKESDLVRLPRNADDQSLGPTVMTWRMVSVHCPYPHVLGAKMSVSTDGCFA